MLSALEIGRDWGKLTADSYGAFGDKKRFAPAFIPLKTNCHPNLRTVILSGAPAESKDPFLFRI